MIFKLISILILFIPFAISRTLANGVVTGKIFWFHLSMALLGICTFYFIAKDKDEKSFIYSSTDFLMLGIVIWCCISYSWKLSFETEKLFFAGQLFILWFLLRYILTKHPDLNKTYLWILIWTGFIEAIWGIMQLHGWASSNHTLFLLTGSFFNPGPYSGYLAIILPIALGVLLEQTSRNILYYFGAICVFAILVVLPAGMSRSAWIAAGLSCAWTYSMYRADWKWIKTRWIRNKVLYTISGIALCISLIGGVSYLYSFKKDSADGRLLMWKVTAQAISKQPFSGVGLGGFPAAYAQSQAEYMTSGKATEQEKLVAGCPEYAFNEYLQIGLEQGIFGLTLFLAWLALIFYKGVRQKRYACCGGILSLALFSFSSYPLQLPDFWIVLIFLGSLCVAPDYIDTVMARSRSTRLSWGKTAFIGAVAITGIGLFWVQKDYYKGYEEWKKAQMFYNSKAYEIAKDNYENLYPLLNHKPEYLFEAAQCLSKTGDYAKANIYLKRAVLLSSDPMLYYIMAKNEQALGQYEEAEKHLLYAIDMVPERIYPYYLLANLYTDTAYYQPIKRNAAIDSVLTKEPKVESRAIREMRANVKNMLK